MIPTLYDRSKLPPFSPSKGVIQDKSAAYIEKTHVMQSLKSKKLTSKELKTLRQKDKELTKKATFPSETQFIDNLALYKKAFNIIAKYG